MFQDIGLPEDWDPRAPQTRLLYNIGDSHPLEYGGHLIYQLAPEKGRVEYQSVYFEEPMEKHLGQDLYKVSRWEIYGDVLKDQDWVDVKQLAANVGATVEDLKKASTDKDIRVRARLYEDIGRFYGFENLDGYPETYSRSKMLIRFPELSRSLVR